MLNKSVVFLPPSCSHQHAGQCVCGGVWAACRPRLPLELFLSGGGVRPSRPVTMGHNLQGEEHQSPHLQHSHLQHWSPTTKYILFTLLYSDVECDLFLTKCVFFFPKREGKGLVVPGGQCALCVVCDRGASQLFTAATDTWVRVRYHINLVWLNHIPGLTLGHITKKQYYDYFTVNKMVQ